MPQGRLQCGQGIEQPFDEQAPSGLAANFTLHIMGILHITSCQVGCKHYLQLKYSDIDLVFRGVYFTCCAMCQSIHDKVSIATRLVA